MLTRCYTLPHVRVAYFGNAKVPTSGLAYAVCIGLHYGLCMLYKSWQMIDDVMSEPIDVKSSDVEWPHFLR